MNVFGLTGGIGMGKSAAAHWLAQHAVPVIDTDQLARDIVEPGQPALAEIRLAFGERVIGPDRRLRRDELARIVFADATARRRLEAITHPRIHELWRKQTASWAAAGRPVAVVVIPLLFETGWQRDLHATVCVACSAPTQSARLAERGLSPAQAARRIAAQWPIEKKMVLADYVIWTEGSLEVLARQLERVFL